jgi:hypothetical protein
MALMAKPVSSNHIIFIDLMRPYTEQLVLEHSMQIWKPCQSPQREFLIQLRGFDIISSDFE